MNDLVNDSMEEAELSASSKYSIFESLKYPVCVIGINGILSYANGSFRKLFKSNGNEIRLDWEHPLFPEYRKRLANAYLSAIKGTEKQCFAVMNSPEGEQIAVEIYLFPMYEQGIVSSILVLLKVVDERLLSFDRSTLTLISEDNFQYDNLHFEFSPMPIMRINEQIEIIKCGRTMEGFIGYSSEELIEKKRATCDTIFKYDFEKVKKAALDLISGGISFKRIGEVKISTKNNEEKIVNLTLYPIVQSNKISAIEIIMEDITRINELRDKINSMNRVQLLRDITKGLIHSLNNSINVIMSKTQLLHQITEKQSVIDGIQVIEESAQKIIEQSRRVQNFISDNSNLNGDTTEPLANIIEDAIEFSKMQFKVEETENRRKIKIDKKYYSLVNIKTDTRLLREIIISIILKVSASIFKRGIVQITLKKNSDLYLSIKVEKDDQDDQDDHSESLDSLSKTIGLFSKIDIRQIADKLHLKIFEEESSESYSIKAIFPSRMIIEKQKKETKNFKYMVRDLDILIVEDEDALQKILYELFDNMGNRVTICETGNEAIKKFKKNRYDLLITDYGLTGITGIELATRIKEIDENITTILLSGWMLDNLQAYKTVIDLFLPKPFKLDELLQNISKILDDKKG